MADSTEREERLAELRLETAIQFRQYEIDKFWSRAAFFWAFIVAVAGAFGLSLKEPVTPNLPLVLACLGLVISVCWSLAGRGSKFWQESWEGYAAREEKKLLGTSMFSVAAARKDSRSTPLDRYLGARRYSVSRLAIAVSDAVSLAWLAAIFSVLPIRSAGLPCLVAMLTIGATAAFLIVVAVAARSTARSEDEQSG